MNKSMLIGLGAGVALALGIAAVASNGTNLFQSRPTYAQVLTVTPVKETVTTPKQTCHDVTVTHKKPVQDEHKIAGSLLGAVAGGVIGHQFGGGHGKQLATIAGAAAGGYTGHQVQGALQDRDTYTTTEKRCKTEHDKVEKTIGYDVTYKIGEQQGKVRMDQQPGSQIPLDDKGQLLLPAPKQESAASS